MSSQAHSRRDALCRAALAAGGLAAAGMLRPGVARAQTTDEQLRDFLAEAIALEQITALAYSRAADVAGVKADLKQTLELFRDQEQTQANALRSAIDDLGYDAPDPPDSPTDTGVFDDVDGIDDETATRLSGLLEGLEGLQRSGELLDYLTKLEEEQLSFYIAGGPEVDSVDLSTTSAEIAGCQAQHLYVLRGELGDNPVEALVAAGEATDLPAT